MKYKGGEMPSPGPQAEYRIIQDGPRYEQRPVINLMSGHVIPEIASEGTGQITPGSDDWIIYDLWPVIPDKIKGQGAAVNYKRHQGEKRQQNFLASQVKCQRL